MKKQFYTVAAIIVMGITANAQVGIGTTTPDPSSLLEIKSTTKGLLMPRLSAAEMTLVASPALGLQIYNTTTNSFWYYNGAAWVSATGISTEPWFNQATGAAATSNTQNIYQMGNLGIRTVAPSQTVDVNGGLIQVYGSGTTTGFRAIGGTPVTPGADLRVQNNISSASIGLYSNHPLEVITNSIPRMVVTAEGNVAVGTTTAKTKLEINGNGVSLPANSGTAVNAGTITRFKGSDNAAIDFGSNGASGQWIQATDVANLTSSYSLLLNPNGGYVGVGTTNPTSTLHVNGTITATKIQGPSDSRFKKNIKPIENALEKVMKLGGYTYDWKDGSEFPTQTLGKGHDMGVIAQEVEKQFPEAVTTNADGFKAVSYTELVPALIEAMKAQQAQIEELKAAVAKLKK